MIKHLIVAFMLQIAAINSNGQSSDPSFDIDSLKSRQMEIKARLQLTPQQEPTWNQLQKNYLEELRAVKNQASNRREKYRMFQRLKKDHQKQVENILTPEQLRIYEKEMREVRSSLKQKRRSR